MLAGHFHSVCTRKLGPPQRTPTMLPPPQWPRPGGPPVGILNVHHRYKDGQGSTVSKS